MITDDDLQKAFRLISCLHPNRAVALCILLDAYERIAMLRKLQQRRPDSDQPFKLKIPEEGLLQLGIYCASEIWEKDQESERPAKEPKYRPTYDDLLARYIKTLVWKSMDRHSRYAAVGFGCLLFTYQPHEVSSLAEDLFDSDNIRRVKSWMFEQIKKRFRGTKGLTNGNEQVSLDVPSGRQRALIQMALSEFAPWCSCPAATTQVSASASLLETYFDKESEKSEWERIHVLCDPACGGFARLVHEYNSTYRRGNDMRLDDPDNKLGAPRFGDGFHDPEGNDGNGGPADPEDRFNPHPLAPHEIASIKHSFERNQQRRKNYHSSKLRVYVDGEEVATSAHYYLVKQFVVPHTASCVEVFGTDDEGELLLAVFPLACLETSDNVLEQKLSVTHDEGQRIELTISPVPGQPDESRQSFVRLEYSEPLSQVGTKIPDYGGIIDNEQPDDSPKTMLLNAAQGTGKSVALGIAHIGMTVGNRYRILEKLGEGGMGVVYLAQDERVNRPVSVKVFHSSDIHSDRIQWIKRYLAREMKALACVEHRGVARILDYGELSDGQPFLVRQYVSGVSLRTEIKPQGMEPSRIAELSHQLVEVLATLHDHRIVHRDLKPENILLHEVDGKEQIKVLDFGLAKMFAPPSSTNKVVLYPCPYDDPYAERAGASMDFETAGLVGSLGYLSPEQLAGKAAGAASDLYSLGVMVYEMITGRIPFTSNSPRRLLRLQRAGLKGKLRYSHPGLPPTVQEVISRALAFDPQDRYSSARHFGADLASALTGKTGAASAGDLPLANVLVIALLDYFGLTFAEQYRRYRELWGVVREAEEFRRAQTSGQLTVRPTGDGIELVFFGETPLAALKCAMEISHSLKRRSGVRLLMGLHTGPIQVIAGIHDIPVVDDYREIARSVLSHGDAGGILLTGAVVNELRERDEWSRHLKECGEQVDGNGHRLSIFKLCTGEVGRY